MKRCFSRYVDFTGRASRPEFWWFTLFAFVATISVGIIGEVLGLSWDAVDALLVLTWLGLFLPSLAVGVRRLHDTDRAGWWWLISFVPLIGPIILLVFWATPGTSGPNRFGPPPGP